MFVEKTLSLRQQQAPAATGNSWEIFVIFWTRYITVRVTESGPKSRNHSITSFETEKIMLLYRKKLLYSSDNKTGNDFLVGCINQMEIDTIMP